MVGEVALLFNRIVLFWLVLLEILGSLEIRDIIIVVYILFVFETKNILIVITF